MPALDPITAIINLVSTTIQVASEETTDCGKKCRAQCKEETGFLFSGRERCKKECKAKCVNELSPQEKEIEIREDEIKEREARTTAIIIILVFTFALALTLYLLLRKK